MDPRTVFSPSLPLAHTVEGTVLAPLRQCPAPGRGGKESARPRGGRLTGPVTPSL